LEFALEQQPTRLVFIETPGNPTLCVTDIAVAADLAHKQGAMLAVDNTFLTGVLQRPSDLGADFVVLSTTKFVEGHNTSLGGAILHRDPAHQERLLFVRKTLGNIQSPFQAWLTLNGLRTLPLRLAAHCRNAERVAAYLDQHPSIKRVLYPGLRSSKGYAVASRQQSGFGGVVSFVLKGDLAEARTFLQNLRLVTLAENLGSLETLITHPATMTHSDLSDHDRNALGLTDGFLRLSVGIEGANDILRDIEQSLTKTFTGGETCLA
jgi:cystathionine gamma-lyase